MKIPLSIRGIQRVIFIGSLVCLVFFGAFFTQTVSAKETVKEAVLDQATLHKGFTVKTPDGVFGLGVRADISPAPLSVTIKKLNPDETSVEHDGFVRISDTYEFDVKTIDGNNSELSKWLSISFFLNNNQGDAYHQKKLFYWNAQKDEWHELLTSREQLKSRTVYAAVPFAYAQVAVFESTDTIEGYASWYNYALAANRKKYANGVATHLYPIGTKLKITNIENGKSANVEVVSTWNASANEKRRRAFDIVKSTFAKIGYTGQGVISIRAQLLPVVAGAATENPGGGLSESPAADSSPSSGTYKSRAAIVMDQDGNILFGKNADKPYSIASLSKLFTTAVVLDRNPDWSKRVTLQASDDAIGAKLFSVPGDVITVKDLFYSTLTGSTNNGAKALARSTGLSWTAFAGQMNQQAKDAGLTQSVFFEPTGLDPRNVSTAEEVAAFTLKKTNSVEVLQGTTRPVYSFDEISSVDKTIHHDVHSTNTLLTESHPGYTILGSKTGYLDEALYCLMMKVKSKKDGKTYVVVVLGSPTSVVRFNEMKTLLAQFVP